MYFLVNHKQTTSSKHAFSKANCSQWYPVHLRPPQKHSLGRRALSASSTSGQTAGPAQPGRDRTLLRDADLREQLQPASALSVPGPPPGRQPPRSAHPPGLCLPRAPAGGGRTRRLSWSCRPALGQAGGRGGRAALLLLCRRRRRPPRAPPAPPGL